MPWRRPPDAGRAVLAIHAILATASLAACLDSPPETATDDGGGDGPVQLLINPAFEDGTAGWSADGSVEVMTSDDLGLPPSEAGSWVAVLGRGDDDLDSLVQEVTVPDWAGRLEVSGVRCFTTAEGSEERYDEFWIYLESLDGLDVDDVMEASNKDATGAECEWLEFRVAIGDHAGEPLRFVLEAWMDPAVPTVFAVDGLALTAME